MPRSLLIDVTYINAHIPATVPDAEANAIRRMLFSPRFMARLRQALRGVFGQQPALAKVRITLTR